MNRFVLFVVLSDAIPKDLGSIASTYLLRFRTAEAFDHETNLASPFADPRPVQVSLLIVNLVNLNI